MKLFTNLTKTLDFDSAESFEAIYTLEYVKVFGFKLQCKMRDPNRVLRSCHPNQNFPLIL